MTVEELRSQFPILSSQVNGRPLVYLDNAATSQRPASVVECWDGMALRTNANLHRAVHALAVRATDRYEQTREFIRHYLNAASHEEIIFTSGTTMGINLVAHSFGDAFLQEGDEILIAECEHHSDIVPWQLLAERKNLKIKVLPVRDDGTLDVGALGELLTPRTKIACVAQISNVLGIVNPVEEIIRICHEKGCAVLVDGAQGIVHGRVDVRAMDCDFYVFSGHKVFAATGTGVLYGKKELLEQMPPFFGGGEMIETVRFSGTTFAPLPGKFEAGTQDFCGAPTLLPALTLAGEIFADAELRRSGEAVKAYLLDVLRRNPRVRLFGDPADPAVKVPLFSFCVEGAHHEDLALILDKMGVAVRSGQMCAEPLMDRFGVTGMLRASFAPYNTLQEAEVFAASLEKAINMLI